MELLSFIFVIKLLAQSNKIYIFFSHFISGCKDGREKANALFTKYMFHHSKAFCRVKYGEIFHILFVCSFRKEQWLTINFFTNSCYRFCNKRKYNELFGDYVQLFKRIYSTA